MKSLSSDYDSEMAMDCSEEDLLKTSRRKKEEVDGRIA